MKQLTIKEVAPYLPYGLKGVLITDKRDDFINEEYFGDEKFSKGAIWELWSFVKDNGVIYIGEGEFEGSLWKYRDNTFVNFHTGIKLILRNLSDLTKEIEHNGKKFIPITKLTGCTDLSRFEFYDDYILLKDAMYCTDGKGSRDYKIYTAPRTISFNLQGVVGLLIEWHFDIFGLIEQNLAVDINSLNK